MQRQECGARFCDGISSASVINVGESVRLVKFKTGLYYFVRSDNAVFGNGNYVSVVIEINKFVFVENGRVFFTYRAKQYTAYKHVSDARVDAVVTRRIRKSDILLRDSTRMYVVNGIRHEIFGNNVVVSVVFFSKRIDCETNVEFRPVEVDVVNRFVIYIARLVLEPHSHCNLSRSVNVLSAEQVDCGNVAVKRYFLCGVVIDDVSYNLVVKFHRTALEIADRLGAYHIVQFGIQRKKVRIANAGIRIIEKGCAYGRIFGEVVEFNRNAEIVFQSRRKSRPEIIYSFKTFGSRFVATYNEPVIRKNKRSIILAVCGSKNAVDVSLISRRRRIPDKSIPF